MDLIKKMAEDFVKYNISGGTSEYKVVINDVKNKLYEIDDQPDKIKYLNIVLDGNQTEYNKHKLVCKDEEHCLTNFSHESISYFLGNELKKLGIVINDDTFTSEDKQEADSKLDKILEEIQTLKDGQQIIYDQITKDIEELKELYYLGKKKWHRQFIGTAIEMTTSGIVSETVSKSIIEVVKNNVVNLIS